MTKDENMMNTINSNNYPKNKILREFEKFAIDLLVYCYKANKGGSILIEGNNKNGLKDSIPCRKHLV